MTGYRYRQLVTFADTNVVGNVYFSKYVEWQGRCRELFLLEHAAQVARDTAAGRLVLVTIGCRMDYLEECYAMDELLIEMTPKVVAANRITMGFRYRRDSVEVARGEQTVGFMARDGDRLVPVPVPSALVEAMRPFS
ncbi:MAG TPA: acyl-CoA thioesterase [Jatrophihabitans sp.]|nr:acyl-CoA thioesterase [Jatrophihabitans sp.]